jgi:Tol biopolymer transport system component
MKASQSRNIKQLLFILLTVLYITGGVRADFIFGEPVNLGPIINSASSDYGACISADGLELYFCSERPGGFGAADIWVSTRQSIDDPWDPPANLGSTVNSPYNDSYPSLSSDGLTLYFSDAYSGSLRPGGLGGGDIWMTTRPNRSASWGAPVNMRAPINSSNLDISPAISGDGLTLVFTSNNRAGGIGSWDLWISTRSGVQDLWSPPVNFGSTINSGNWDGECGLSWDGRALLFDSGRAGIVGAVDLWMSIRKSLDDPWPATVNLGPVVNSSGNDGTPRVSPDMRTLYICSDRPGGSGSYDLFEAPIVPVVDLNGDGIVDAADICIMVDHWNTDNPMCDIGPAPWGDGIVDVQDLIVLAEHLFEEPGLIAYWKFDETEGAIAYEITGGKDGYLFGDPAWQPAGGKKDGALQLDGIDDYILSIFDLNPADGPFSVCAWVKGGAPGQVIISQMDGNGIGETWLSMDPVSGYLMTDLVPPPLGRFLPQPLESHYIITDEKWHHIGFIWDGLYRALYVDGTEVAKDTSPLAALKYSNGGLYIGANKFLDADTFFSGLIDDVRIYDVALTADKIASFAQ